MIIDMLTEKDYCDYDTCVALKELGYVGSRQECECFGAYFNFGKDIFTDSLDNTEVGTNEYLRVPLYLAQKWLREEKQIEIAVHSFDYVGEPYFADIHMYREVRCACSYADSYEEALLDGIKEAVKLLKEE